jgi:putative peptidoglycan lipid II flippase
MIFYGIAAVATGILTARRRFAPPMFAPILNNLAVIVTMLLFVASAGDISDGRGLTTAQTTLLGLGTTLGVVALAVALWPAVRSTGFRFRFRTDWRHDAIRSMARLGRWVVVYVLINQVAYVVIINMGQRLGEGVYTAYSQAFLFFSLPHAVIAVSIATALLPGMAERWQAGLRDGVSELFSRGLRDTWVVMLPAAAGLIALAGPIVRLFAEYGEIGAEDADLLTEALTAFAVGLPFFSAFQLLTKTFYATHDSRTPALVNIGAATVNLTANLLLAFAVGLGVSGLALGHAASYAAGTAALLWLLRGRLGHLDGRRVAATAAKAAIAATASGLAAFATSKVVAEIAQVKQAEWRLVQVVASVIVGVLVFLGSAFMFRIDEVDEVRKALRSRFRR